MEHLVFGTLASRLPRIGGMATMPSRFDSCCNALLRLLPQLDRLYLYLDKHEAIPAAFTGDPRLVPLLPAPGERPLGDGGKFLGLHAFGAPCLYFSCDDDIIYRPGYVAHMAAGLRRHGYRALVAAHGGVFHRPNASYRQDRLQLTFADAQHLDCLVDEVGTGTMAMHSGVLPLDPRRWAETNMADLNVMLEALRAGVPRFTLRKPADLLRPLDGLQPDSLHRQLLADETVQNRLLQAALHLFPEPWHWAGG